MTPLFQKFVYAFTQNFSFGDTSLSKDFDLAFLN